jgi:DNA-binding SARP family transcriptional activator
MGIEFRILGPLEVIRDGRVLPLGSPKQRALLALLLVHANETVSRDRLIEELWAENPPASVESAFHVYLSRVRRLLDSAAGGELLSRQAHGYTLRVGPDQLDATRFEGFVGEGNEALAAGKARLAADRFRQALALWRGPPLADLQAERFAIMAGDRLNEERVSALEQRLEADLALGRHRQLIGELETLVAEHPYRERLRGQLMLALYRSGRQAEALRAYQQARRTLADELGLEPSHQLKELEQALLRQDPTLDLAPTEAAAETARSAFVGRESELAELSAALEDALSGHGRLCLLRGEPGIGKSRLAEELITQARVRGARVLVGRCWEAGGAPAYWPWVQSLRSYLREEDPEALRAQLGASAADLTQILPELREILPGLSEPAAVEVESARFRLFDATTQFLRNASERRPILIVLDDLHAADEPSLLLLQFVARELGSTHILLLGAFRDVDPISRQPLAAMLAEVGREAVTRRLSLGGLSEQEVADYVEQMASEIASPALVAALYEETEGNPLFVAETVRLLALEGLRSEPTGARIAIPQNVRDVIARRLTHLSEECNRVLVLASVMGREFTLLMLARVSGVSEDELLETLDEAMAARVISEVPSGRGRLRFAHVLTRDTLYEGLTTARRVRLHRVVVGALEAAHEYERGEHLAELVHHAIAGSDFDKALSYARQAGDGALTLLAYEEAARLYETALDALDLTDPSDDAMRCELLLSLGEARIRAGESSPAKRAFREAAALARRLGLPNALARAAVGYGGRIVWARAGADDRLVPLLEEGLAALAEEDVELRTRLLARLAGALRDEHSRERRDRLSREAVELARRAGDPTALAYALDGRAAAIFAPDTVAECLKLSSELRDAAELVGDRERVVHGHLNRLIAEVMVGDISQANADLDAASHIADELRQPAQLHQVCAAQGMLALAAGKLTEAEHLVAQAFEHGELAQPEMAIPTYALQRYALCDFRGRLAEVEPAIWDVVADYPARGAFHCALARLHALLGRMPEARQTLGGLARDEFSVLPFDLEWLFGMSFLAETCALLGDRASGAVIYRLLLPWATFNVVDVPEGFRGSVSRYLAVLATLTKRLEDAELHFEEALEMNRHMGARPWLARTQHDYARMLLARGGAGDSERAERLVDQALATYQELGMESNAVSASKVVSTR